TRGRVAPCLLTLAISVGPDDRRDQATNAAPVLETAVVRTIGPSRRDRATGMAGLKPLRRPPTTASTDPPGILSGGVGLVQPKQTTGRFGVVAHATTPRPSRFTASAGPPSTYCELDATTRGGLHITTGGTAISTPQFLHPAATPNNHLRTAPSSLARP